MTAPITHTDPSDAGERVSDPVVDTPDAGVRYRPRGTRTYSDADAALIGQLRRVQRTLSRHHARMMTDARERSELIHALRARGWSHRRIASEVGVSPSTILQAERREWS
ncbi:helix-turn-helix domain-containing protein [Mycobacteroides abscessus subsp. abscessus]|nr:helix-turn-helix domain-containing protein [Mycobacteroides abscessus subsp. abscessus]RIT75002.1 helix-turn-helix domain-containing protein [Mycobacteroides abscessus]